jgi:hypothetical protein
MAADLAARAAILAALVHDPPKPEWEIADDVVARAMAYMRAAFVYLDDLRNGALQERRDYQIYAYEGPSRAETGALYAELGGIQYVGLTAQEGDKRLRGQCQQARAGNTDDVCAWFRGIWRWRGNVTMKGFAVRRHVITRVLAGTYAEARALEVEYLRAYAALANREGDKFRATVP